VLCLAVDSLTQTKRKCRSRPADARGRIRLGNCLDLDLAARTGDGDKLLARATDEFALGVARGLEERVQACRASGPCWPGRTRRALWADAAACTVKDHVDQVDQVDQLDLADRLGQRLRPLDPLDRVVRQALVVPAGLQSSRPSRSRAQVR
jgi:hypothetical protein